MHSSATMLPAATHRFAVAVLGAFSLVVASVVARHARTLFLPRRGRSHRLAAAAYLAWLLLGVLETCRGANRSPARVAAYDAALGVLGTVATCTAARDFGGHSRWRHPDIGALLDSLGWVGRGSGAVAYGCGAGGFGDEALVEIIQAR